MSKQFKVRKTEHALDTLVLSTGKRSSVPIHAQSLVLYHTRENDIDAAQSQIALANKSNEKGNSPLRRGDHIGIRLKRQQKLLLLPRCLR